MKLYNKPELSVEQFDVEDVITVSNKDAVNGGAGDVDLPQSAGMEFDISVDGNEF